jgi:hypothetical protein
MDNFEKFGRQNPPPIISNNSYKFREWHDDSDYDTEEEEDKKAIAIIKNETAAGNQTFKNNLPKIDNGLVQINARQGLKFNPNTNKYEGGRRRRPTRRSRKTKSKRRKTRRRR